MIWSLQRIAVATVLAANLVSGSAGATTGGGERTCLVLADGYSYTELIPAPGASGAPGETFIRVFHAFFSPDDDDRLAPAAPTGDIPVTTSEQG